ncbi:unnamed protein product [Gongylonema pulchrum]|uniref:Transposase n=1 Tax=Gongylonema pulchrum TaxID=637853 RepID=A0A183DEP7_9BILA|nr:unnamed protein product [Gongylonema pulchrum]
MQYCDAARYRARTKLTDFRFRIDGAYRPPDVLLGSRDYSTSLGLWFVLLSSIFPTLPERFGSQKSNDSLEKYRFSQRCWLHIYRNIYEHCALSGDGRCNRPTGSSIHYQR